MPQVENATEIYYEVARSIKMPDWIEFARGTNWLDLPRNTIEDIQHDYSMHISEQKYQMLICWEQRNGRKATPQCLKEMARKFLERARDTITTTDSRPAQQSLPQPIPQTNQPVRQAPMNRDTIKFRQLLMKVSNKLTPENVSSLQNMFQLTERQFSKSDIIFHLVDNEYLGTSSTADKLTELRNYLECLERIDLCNIIDQDRRATSGGDAVDAQPSTNVAENVETLEGQYEEEEPLASLSSTPSELTPAETMVQDLAERVQKGLAVEGTPSGQASSASALQSTEPGKTVHITNVTVHVAGNASIMNSGSGEPQALPRELLSFGSQAVDFVDDVKDMCSYEGLDVFVAPSTKQFFDAHKNNDEVYKVSSKPKGNALIINNIDFPVWGRKHRRHGAEKDRLLLAKLFGKDGLGLEVTVEENKNAKEMGDLLEQFSKNDCHVNADMSVVIIMSHGGFVEGVGECFFGSHSGYVAAHDVLRLFDNDNCPNLLWKPKIFIFQFCRGSVADKGVRTKKDAPDQGPYPSLPMPIPADSLNRLLPQQDASDGTSHAPTRSDMLIAYATQQGNLSFRSWFTNAIVNVFSRKACNKNLCDMLKEVKRGLAKKVSSTDYSDTHECKEMADIRDVLLRNVHFFPGHP